MQYKALHDSYQHPGESTPQVECWAPDGTHHDVTGQAIFTFFGAAVAGVFVPVYAIALLSSLRQPQTPPPHAPQTVTSAAPFVPASQAPSPASHAIAQRLETLEALRAEGQITPQEYDQKHKEILSSV